MLFFSCQSTPKKPEIIPIIQTKVIDILETPILKTLHKVKFIEKEEGLFLEYEEYLKLEENIILMRSYAKELEFNLNYYINLIGDFNERTNTP